MDPFNASWWTNMAWHGYSLSEDGTKFCEMLPTKINSFGLSEKILHKSVGLYFWEYPLPNLELIILSVFFFWQFFEILFKMSNIPIPKMPSMMLGCVVINLFSYTRPGSLLHRMFFPDDGRPKVAETGGAFGFVMYWFLKGVSIDVGMLRKTEPRAALIGFNTLVIPYISGYILMRTRKHFGKLAMTELQYQEIILLQSLSSFAGVNGLLTDLKINHSEFGRMVQSCAAVTDLVIFIMVSGTVLLKGQKGLPHGIVIVLVIGFLVYIVWPVMLWIIKQTPEGRLVKDVYIYLVMATAYFVYMFWLNFFQFSTYGWFIIGLATPAGPPLGSALIQRFECFNVGVLLPLFGSLSMEQLDISWLMREILNLKHMEGFAYEAISVILIVTVVKFVVTAITAFAVRIPYRDSIVLAMVLSNRSIFELGYLGYIVELKMFDNKSFTIAALSVLVSSLLTPIAIEFMYEPQHIFSSYRDRNMLTLKHDSKLKTLVCIHKPDHITSMVNFVELFNPTQESKLECNVLHLVELIGQAIPTFISHKMQKPKVGTRSCSRNVITAFLSLRRHLTKEAISIDIFTSASLVEHMHEDLCWLALDKNVALVVLPFHRSWSVDRSTIVSDDKAMQNLNHKVLKRASCSVGIFVYRKPLWESQMHGSCYKVCAIVVGGKDDKEALAFTNRMRRNKQTSVTILHLIPQLTTEESEDSVQKLDYDDIKEIMKTEDSNENDSWICIEKSVKEGAETSVILRSIAYDYDLFIVGRSSGMNSAVTKGLNEWTEFEELGALGDVIASKEFPSRASVLVLQQQQY
ncbi:Cation/H+ exchanger [Arabidopsis thaliana x Arabidopsis arenosa]|uniref:Cation/H(+) antiporter 7 n=3 Tax=Arabidopsis TaxID=3701 RepID=CHX7_ARATH|nr:Cation/hydrogen exchanger family protein [Arabidopsis thaliana]Q9ZUV9.2 RecName: Full=Cation/H(+) antiporter 7; AltName: Full=Protein CATION/H+ EXCHANGER 7; Short=AtCHX7 [Arabidopsis thaliana]AEC08087.1 Cation/hydrogen exchanger family protein [Arabidopsis thaliana]KAG7637730.1 Cation/H+ exchanger [Arabidopsis thaliana x Arabidopsis arenosa]|eukprot:NP_180384.2 Cation/hydrogen exchanger family protein [Arabidopsis thaliana]